MGGQEPSGRATEKVLERRSSDPNRPDSLPGQSRLRSHPHALRHQHRPPTGKQLLWNVKTHLLVPTECGNDIPKYYLEFNLLQFNLIKCQIYAPLSLAVISPSSRISDRALLQQQQHVSGSCCVLRRQARVPPAPGAGPAANVFPAAAAAARGCAAAPQRVTSHGLETDLSTHLMQQQGCYGCHPRATSNHLRDQGHQKPSG